MGSARSMALLIGLTCGLRAGLAEDTRVVDFARDVQPLLKTHCIDCHGPNEQKNGFRLDRRADAMRGGTGTMIGPGSAASSHLFLRLVGNQYGRQMPLDGPLSQKEIDTIKAWVDQGAKWPDELAGEANLPPPDPKAARLMTAIRQGDRATLQSMLRDDHPVINLKGPDGSTPLMYAVLYGDAAMVGLLLDKGANPNVSNEAGATALMWALDDLEKTRLLLARGADANAVSANSRTPLLIATGTFGSTAVVKLLLENGANPNVTSPSYRGPLTPLREAARVGDDLVLRMLLDGGADPKNSGPFPLIEAMKSNSAKCVDLFIHTIPREALNTTLCFLGPPFGDPQAIENSQWIHQLLDQGADVNAKDPAGRTFLMLAAQSESTSAKSIQMLMDRGAHLDAKSPQGETALDFAWRHGNTPVVDLLVKAGAMAGNPSVDHHIQPAPVSSARAAVARSIPLLQSADVLFRQKSGCVSCHHNSLTAMTVAAARSKGLPVDDSVARKQLNSVAVFIDGWRERALQGLGIPGDASTVNYVLAGMAVENYPADPATDALAHFLKTQQSPEGRWRLVANRPPLGSSEFEVTAVAMRALQAYGPQSRRAEYEKSVRLAASWLQDAEPKSTPDRAFQLLGLRWAGVSRVITDKIAGELLSKQRPELGKRGRDSLMSHLFRFSR